MTRRQWCGLRFAYIALPVVALMAFITVPPALAYGAAWLFGWVR